MDAYFVRLDKPHQAPNDELQELHDRVAAATAAEAEATRAYERAAAERVAAQLELARRAQAAYARRDLVAHDVTVRDTAVRDTGGDGGPAWTPPRDPYARPDAVVRDAVVLGAGETRVWR